MTDLDFDELDKAVNSLMADVPASKDKEAAPTEKVVTLPDDAIKGPSVESVSTSPVSSTKKPAEEKSPASQQAPSLATKRSGRFMDVVHPSSDMRPASFPNRSGTALKPLSDTTKPDETSAPTPEKAAPAAAEPATSSNELATLGDVQSPWPDPIELHAPAEKESDATPKADLSAQEPDASEQTSSTDDATELPSPDENETAQSPFLPDAKVEKRPLGSAAESAVAPAATAAESVDQPDKTPEPMPEELGSDVLAIESSEKPNIKDESSEDSSTPDQKSDGESNLKGDTVTAAPAPSGPVSITQQYKAEGSSRDESHAALYDTAADPHALTHPAKKRSGLWVVLAIIILIALGAGLGAWAYFQGII